MVGYLKPTRLLAMLTVLLLICALSACITYVPREEEPDMGGTQAVEETESTADEAESERDTDKSTEQGIETDSKGFPNLPEDDQTKRY